MQANYSDQLFFTAEITEDAEMNKKKRFNKITEITMLVVLRVLCGE